MTKTLASIVVGILIGAILGAYIAWRLKPNTMFMLVRESGKVDINPEKGDILKWRFLLPGNTVNIHKFPHAPDLCKDGSNVRTCRVQAEGQYTFSCNGCVDPGVTGGHSGMGPLDPGAAFDGGTTASIGSGQTGRANTSLLPVVGHPYYSGTAPGAGEVLDANFDPNPLDISAGATIVWSLPVQGDEVTAWTVAKLNPNLCQGGTTTFSSNGANKCIVTTPAAQYYCVVVTTSSGVSSSGKATLTLNGALPVGDPTVCP